MKNKELEITIKLLNEENGNTWAYYIEEGDVSSEEVFNEKVKWGNTDEDGTHWNGTAPITFADCENKLTEAQSVIALENVHDNRRNEYPEIAQQLDDIYHNGIDGWKASIKAIKDKYPKS